MQFKIKYYSIKTFYEILILYCCLFPYASFGLNKMDSQPWALLLVSFYILFNFKFERRNIFIFWIFSIFVIILSMLFVIDKLYITELLRAISNYSIVFFIWAFSIIINKKFNPLKHYIIASWVYVIYAIIQMSGFGFLDWISPNRTSIERGVTSFAAEPTFFAIILFFISWLIFNSINKMDSQKKNEKIIRNLGYFTIFLNFFSILFIAKSATVILMMLIIGTISLIFFASKKVIFYTLFFSFLTSLFIYINLKPNFLFKYGLESSRPIKIVMLLSELEFNNLHLIIYKDESINGRVAQVLIPYLGLIENKGFPGGYFTFENISNKVIKPGNFFYSPYGVTNKIQSFIGVFVYELGVLGIIVLSFMGLSLKKEFNWKWREILILFISLIPSVPLGMGLIPLLFGSKIISKHNN